MNSFSGFFRRFPARSLVFLPHTPANSPEIFYIIPGPLSLKRRGLCGCYTAL